jgi:hypothetical protein
MAPDVKQRQARERNRSNAQGGKRGQMFVDKSNTYLSADMKYNILRVETTTKEAYEINLRLKEGRKLPGDMLNVMATKPRGT